MAEFKKVAEISELSSGRKEITIEENKILLLNLNGKFMLSVVAVPTKVFLWLRGK